MFLCENMHLYRLHFEVRVYSNLTVKDINNMLEKVSLEDHHDRDMLAGKVLGNI